MAKFRVGERLIHPVHGAGTVVAYEKREEEGDTREYYVIELETPNGRLLTPVEQADQLGLRKLVEKGDRPPLWKVFAGRPRKLSPDYRERQADIAKRLRRGNFTEVGRVIRDLAWLNSQGGLNMNDRRLLKRAKGLFAEELAAAEEMEIGEAISRVESALERRVSRWQD
ncbi:MAG: CarD family transcriptional regulator [Anaerolineae bacterium]